MLGKLEVRYFAAAATLEDGGFPTEAFNSPCIRRAKVLEALESSPLSLVKESVEVSDSEALKSLAGGAHDADYVAFLAGAWGRWAALKEHDPDFFALDDTRTDGGGSLLAMVPGNFSNRDAANRPSKSVYSECCYYSTDRCTPIFSELAATLLNDATVAVRAAEALAEEIKEKRAVVYAAVTLPGHHAAFANSGGYCYLNNVAIAVKRVGGRVAVLDLDYHCGNGTLGIFWEDPDVFVCSIHADPELEYPYCAGYADQTGHPTKAPGASLCIPLQPRATWDSTYKVALDRACESIANFKPQALFVSIGLDVLIGDPVAVPGAGFDLQVGDLEKMGRRVAQLDLPACVFQEGGYDLDRVGPALAAFLSGLSNS